jgi:hypothetical protein
MKYINPFVAHLLAQGMNRRTAYRRAKKYGLITPQMNPMVTRLIEGGMNRRSAYRHASNHYPTTPRKHSAYEYSTGEFI